MTTDVSGSAAASSDSELGHGVLGRGRVQPDLHGRVTSTRPTCILMTGSPSATLTPKRAYVGATAITSQLI